MEWIEIDCPACGMDYDIDLPHEGDWHCPCGWFTLTEAEIRVIAENAHD